MIPFQLYGRPLSEPIGDLTPLPLPRWPPTVQPPFLNVDYLTTTTRLRELPGCHLELDGSFGWTSASQPNHRGNPWELYGTIYDDGERVIYVEMRGNCDANRWVQLLDIFSPKRQSASVLLLFHERILIPAEDLPILWSSGLDLISV